MKLSMLKHVLTAVPLWIGLLLYRIPLALMGPLVVPFGLLTLREVETDRPVNNKDWKFLNMHPIFWLWDNERDGAMGDDNLHYWNMYPPKLSEYLPSPLDKYFKYWYWLAIRNPLNNGSRFVDFLNVDLKKPENEVELLAGQSYVSGKYESYGWQFCRAGKWYYGYFVALEPKKVFFNRKFTARVGWKVEPRYNDTDWSKDPQKALKGFTIKLGFYK